MQVMTDAYMTQETALGNRYTFDDLLSSNSPWPTWPDYAQSTVSLGKTSTSSAVSATVRRYRESKTPSSNLTGLEVYSLTSILSYQVGDKTYTKTRHTVRSR